jgi:phospholipid/cholesterol/gamma-HCH transport system substrate-binding protein
VIAADAVGTEANDVLASLNTLLTSVDVGNLSSALGAVSITLRGRGDQLGQLLVDVNSYVEHLNPSIPALNADLATGADVAKIYAGATPDLVRTLSNLAVTSRTITDERDALSPLLAGVISASDATRDILDRNGASLATAMEVLRPTTSMLADYSPMFPCLFATANQERIHLEKVMGYQYAGLHMYDQLIPGVAPYQYSRDLPKIVPPIAPTCFGGPIKPADGPVPYVRLGDGTNSFVPSDEVILRPGSPLPSPLPRVGPSQGATGLDGRRAPDGSAPAPPAPAVPGLLPEGLIGRPGEQNARGSR